MKRKKEGISGKESIAEQRLRTRFMDIPQSSKELQKRTDQRLFKIYLCLDPLQTQWIRVSEMGPGLWHFKASSVSLMCERAEDSPRTVRSCGRCIRKSGFEEMRLLMELLLSWARSFELGPVPMRVLSPSGAFFALQTSFNGRLIWFRFKMRGGSGRFGKPEKWMTQSSGREVCALRWGSRKE